MPDGATPPRSAPAWYRPPDARVLGWVAAVAGDGWRVERSSRLRGGIAAAVDAVVLRAPSGAHSRLVLKRWTRPEWADEDPEFTPAREAAVLEAISDTAIPAPGLVAVDPDGAATGVPALLMTHVDGRRPSASDEARPARIGAMAEALARIHDVRGPVLGLVDAFRSWYELDAVRIPSSTRRLALWQAARALVATPPPDVPARFLHRDYHPANTIWLGARLSGIVDWVSASTGPPAADLAHWRTNLGTRHGVAVADRVLDAYRAVTGETPRDQTWWDLRLLLDYLDEPDAIVGEELERFERYLAALLARV